MKPRRPISFTREITTMEPSSTSVSRPEWKPETQERPIIKPDPQPETTLTDYPGTKMLQGFGTPQKQSLPSKPAARKEAEFQQEQGVQQSALLQKFLTPLAFPAPHQSSPRQKVHLDQQEATSHNGPGVGKVYTTQKEPQLREEHVGMTESGPAEPPLATEVQTTSTAQAVSGLHKKLPTQIDLVSQERPEKSDPTTQQTPLVQGDKSEQGSLTESGFLTRLHEPSRQRSSQEWKTFFDCVTESDTEKHLSSSSKSNPPESSCSTVILEIPLLSKKKPDFEKMSGYGGKLPHGKKAMPQKHKHYWDTGESEPGRPEHSRASRLVVLSILCIWDYNTQVIFQESCKIKSIPHPTPSLVCREGMLRHKNEGSYTRPRSLETANTGVKTGFASLHTRMPPYKRFEGNQMKVGKSSNSEIRSKKLPSS